MSDPVDLLTRLVSICACEVSVTVNAHTMGYETVEEYLGHFDDDDYDAATRAEMIARNHIVEVQAYPRTPICFYRSVHWDLATAIREVLEAMLADRAREVPR